jgi:hypothetical protein
MIIFKILERLKLLNKIESIATWQFCICSTLFNFFKNMAYMFMMVTNGIYNYKFNHKFKHICHILMSCVHYITSIYFYHTWVV